PSLRAIVAVDAHPPKQTMATTATSRRMTLDLYPGAHGRREGQNVYACGSRAPSVWLTALPVGGASNTSVVGAPSSVNTWRQAPQGVATGSATTATARIRFAPAATAAATALRSAQTVRPYDAFSTLQPACTRPRSSSTAAPTRNFEYGACARSRTARAAARSFFRCAGVVTSAARPPRRRSACP